MSRRCCPLGETGGAHVDRRVHAGCRRHAHDNAGDVARGRADGRGAVAGRRRRVGGCRRTASRSSSTRPRAPVAVGHPPGRRHRRLRDHDAQRRIGPTSTHLLNSRQPPRAQVAIGDRSLVHRTRSPSCARGGTPRAQPARGCRSRRSGCLDELLSREQLRAAADGLLDAGAALLKRRARRRSGRRRSTSGAALIGGLTRRPRASTPRAAEGVAAVAFAANVLQATSDASDSEKASRASLHAMNRRAARRLLAEDGPAADPGGTRGERPRVGLRARRHGRRPGAELSAMAWRAIARRCPSRAMTVVGDLAQTSSSAGAHSWRDALEGRLARRVARRELDQLPHAGPHRGPADRARCDGPRRHAAARRARARAPATTRRRRRRGVVRLASISAGPGRSVVVAVHALRPAVRRSGACRRDDGARPARPDVAVASHWARTG